MIRKVTRANQSPLNKLQWHCDLECGHVLWVTSKSRPKTAICNECAEPAKRSEFDKFKDMAKTIVNVPKEKKRKPKKKGGK